MFLDGEVRAYPVHMLHAIEVCNDTLAGQHIAVTY